MNDISRQKIAQIHYESIQEIDDQKDDNDDQKDTTSVKNPIIGTNVIITGLETDKGRMLNGLAGVLTGYNKDTKRWSVNLSDGQNIKILEDKFNIKTDQSDKKHDDLYKLVDPGFIDYIEELIKTMQETGNQFNFETIEQDMKESSKPQHCAACSKRLTDPSIWSRTVNIDKKNGEFLINSYHIKCMYNAPFKV